MNKSVEVYQFVEEVKNEVLKLAKYNPDAVYKGDSGGACYYCRGEVKDNKTGDVIGEGCIVGQALTNLRPELREYLSLPVVENHSIGDVLTGCINKLYGVNVPYSKFVKEKLLLSNIQHFQDTGETWGVAVEKSIESHPRD